MNPDSTHDAEPVETIKTEHQLQIGLACALCDAVRSGADAKHTRRILDQLADFSEAHFMSEQLLMRLASYPDYDNHVLDHDHMMEMLRGIAACMAEGTGDLTAGEAQDMLYFLARHISTRDRRFFEYYLDWRQRASETAVTKAPLTEP